MKFSYYSDLYLKFGKKEWKNSTFVKNAGIVANRLRFFENMEISDIKPSVIRVWLDGISDVCNKSKKHYLSALSQIIKIALEDEEISKNPLVHIKKMQHITPRIEPFTNEEVLKILEASKKYNENFRIFLKVGFFTGLRTGEILALKISDIDLQNRVISVNSTRSRFGESTPKTYLSIRKVPILNTLYPALNSFIFYRSWHKYLLETQYGKPYKDTSVFTYDYWKPILRELNLKYRRLYNMRHTYATNMLYQNFVSPVELAKLLGHSTPKMVYDVYVNYLNSNLKDFDRNIKIY